MQEDIIKKVIRALDNGLKDKGSYAQFDNDSYKPIKFSKEYFHDIKQLKSDRKITFIDGGNAEIIGAANFSVQLVKIYSVTYQNNKRIHSRKYEFFLFATATENEGNIEYKSEIFPITYMFEAPIFDSFDNSIMEGKNRVKVTKIAETIRKLAELKIAQESISDLGPGDIIIRDGDLKATATHEKEYFEELYSKASLKKVTIAALSKTSELFTNTGNSLLMALKELAPSTSWYYFPLVEINDENHKSDVYIVKLHNISDYAFKLEVYNGGNYDPDELIFLLQDNAKDPIFFGYPYGLIDADRFARVSNQEIETLRIQYMAKSGDNWPLIKGYLNTKNAHDILDKIS